MKNEILEEIWRVKDQIASENDYDIDKIAALLQEKEKTNQANLVDLSLIRAPVRAASQSR